MVKETIINFKNEKKKNLDIIYALKALYCSRVSERTLQRTWSRFMRVGTAAYKKSPGRPQKCTPRNERVVCRLPIANRQWSLRLLGKEASNSLNFNLSSNNISRIFNRYHLYRRIAARMPLLTKSQRRKRKTWAKKYHKWPVVQWSRVEFLNVKIFRVNNHRHGSFVTRTLAKKYHPSCFIYS